MQTIQLETKIAAPIERCFLLSLSIDLHVESTKQTGERAIAGVPHGLIGLGESVTWRGRHFGVMLTQTSEITAYKQPIYFQDTMTRGLFRSFVHDHYFVEDADGATVMRDVLRCSTVGTAWEACRDDRPHVLSPPVPRAEKSCHPERGGVAGLAAISSARVTASCYATAGRKREQNPCRGRGCLHVEFRQLTFAP